MNNSLFGGTVLDVLAKLFPSGEVEAKVRVRYEGQRVTDIQVKVYGKVVLKHSDIAIPLKLLEGFLRHELEVSELSLTEKCEGLRDFLSYIRDRVNLPPSQGRSEWLDQCDSSRQPDPGGRGPLVLAPSSRERLPQCSRGTPFVCPGFGSLTSTNSKKSIASRRGTSWV